MLRRGRLRRLAGEHGFIDGGRNSVEQQRVVVRGDGDELISITQHGVHRGIELHAILRLQADHGGGFKQRERFAVCFSGEFRERAQIDLVSAKVEHLRIYGGKAGLAAGLRNDAGDDGVFKNDLRLTACGNPRDIDIFRLAQNGDNLVRRCALRRRVDDRKKRLNYVCVVVFVDDDGFCGMKAEQAQIVKVDRATVSCDDARGLRVRNAVANRLVHLHLVGLAHDDDASVLLVAVGLDQLGKNCENLARPAEDHGVSALHHDGMTLLQGFQLGRYARGQETDEDTEDEDAAERDDEHRADEEEAAGVAAHRARVERAEHAHPEERKEACSVAGAGHPNDEGNDRDHQQRHDCEARNQHAGAFGHQVVKTVFELVFHVHLIKISFAKTVILKYGLSKNLLFLDGRKRTGFIYILCD